MSWISLIGSGDPDSEGAAPQVSTADTDPPEPPRYVNYL